MSPQRVKDLRLAITERRWHFLSPEERERFLLEQLPEPEFSSQYDLLADFRHSGFRMLGDLVCDMEEENTRKERGHLLRESDAAAFAAMLRAYLAKPIVQPYREAVSGQCRTLLDAIVKPTHAVAYLVTMGKRDLLWALVPEQIERQVLRYDE